MRQVDYIVVVWLSCLAASALADDAAVSKIKIGQKYDYGVVDSNGNIAGVEGFGRMVIVATNPENAVDLVKSVNAEDIDGWTDMILRKKAYTLIDGARLTVLEVNPTYVECTIVNSSPRLPAKIMKGYVPISYFGKDEYKLIRKK
jgi:hypothetical protein